MSTLTCPHFAISLHLHAPCFLPAARRWAFITSCTISRCLSQVRTPHCLHLVAVCIASPCPSQLHAPCHHAPYSLCTLSFQFFLLISSVSSPVAVPQWHNPASPQPSHSSSDGSISSTHHALPTALGSNTSDSAVAAFLATLKSLMLAVPLVGAGATFVSNDAPLARTPRWPHIQEPPCSCSQLCG
jgi:hypothetical protein